MPFPTLISESSSTCHVAYPVRAPLTSHLVRTGYVIPSGEESLLSRSTKTQVKDFTCQLQFPAQFQILKILSKTLYQASESAMPMPLITAKLSWFSISVRVYLSLYKNIDLSTLRCTLRCWEFFKMHMRRIGFLIVIWNHDSLNCPLYIL